MVESEIQKVAWLGKPPSLACTVESTSLKEEPTRVMLLQLVQLVNWLTELKCGALYEYTWVRKPTFPTVTANVPSAIFEYAGLGELASILESEYHCVCSEEVPLIREAGEYETHEKLRPVIMKSGVDVLGRLLTLNSAADVSLNTVAPMTTGASNEKAFERIPTESE